MLIRHDQDETAYNRAIKFGHPHQIGFDIAGYSLGYWGKIPNALPVGFRINQPFRRTVMDAFARAIFSVVCLRAWFSAASTKGLSAAKVLLSMPV